MRSHTPNLKSLGDAFIDGLFGSFRLALNLVRHPLRTIKDVFNGGEGNW